jgi:hypothetical protein
MRTVTPAARAFLAWQLADHWGNRRFARPRPRAEVVSAALLAGWGGDEGEPHCACWRSAVDRAARVSRYAALLLALSGAARTAGAPADPGDTGAFREEMGQRAATWRDTLAGDARYELVLEGPGLETNLALLAAWQGVVDGIVDAGSECFATRAPARVGPPVEVTVAPLGDRRWRLRPWPLEGERLQLHCEVPAAGWVVERATFTLLRPSARG